MVYTGWGGIPLNIFPQFNSYKIQSTKTMVIDQFFVPIQIEFHDLNLEY